MRTSGSRKVPVGTLRLDARTDKAAVAIYDDRGYNIAGGSLVNLRNVANLSYPGGERGLPASIRATWRTGSFSSDSNGNWTGGTLAGDYTVKVAERIPEEVFEFIRTKGGSLRLKIRLVDNGVLVGWDVEKIVSAATWKPGDGPSGVQYHMAGGDFREDRIFNGKVVEAGWEKAPSSVNNMGRSRQP